jgi:D-alanyl-D-alanine carboxypeptidase (penicillin-binding protein 5/6)
MKLLFPAKNKLVYLSMLAFIFIASSALALSRPEVLYEKTPVQARVYPSFPVVSAQGVLALDLDSGMSLYEKNADEPLLPASTTKIMTALVAMDYYPSNMPLRVDGVRVIGQKMGLKEGEEITAGDLLYGLLVFSANDAAEVLAANYPGGREMFINVMNIKAEKLGLASTHFENPAGLDGVNHVSTARDLTNLAQIAMGNPQFAEIVNTKQRVVGSTDGRIAHSLVSTNELLGKVAGVAGVKTGWTENARENLVTYVNRDGHRVLIALLGSQDRFGETKELIDWMFTSYAWQEVKYPSLRSNP